MHSAGAVPAENVMIDGIGVGDIGNIVLRDRKVLSEDGIFVAVVTINRREKENHCEHRKSLPAALFMSKQVVI